jgi:hypothetical protein
MGNAYRDIARLATEPAAVEEFPTLVEGDQRLLGLAVAYVAEPVPITLTPGYEYRLRHVSGEDGGYWVMERRHV